MSTMVASSLLCQGFVEFCVAVVTADGANDNANCKDAPIENDPIAVVLALLVRLVEDQNWEQDK